MESITPGERSSRSIGQKGFGSEEDKDAYEWCRSKLLIYGFNNACNTIAAGYLKVGDESMSAIRFRTTEK